VRWEHGSGDVIVSGGIPLKRGMLFPGQLKFVRVVVDGADRSLHVDSLAGRHADGSLRAVLIQFRDSVRSSNWKRAQLLLGEPRAGSTLAIPDEYDRGLPQASPLPSDANYLVQTELAGPAITASRNAFMGPAFARYEQNFTKFIEHHWKLDGELWSGANYYDRALIYFSSWLRTAKPEYFRRGMRIAMNYRTKYLEANQYATSPHWSQVEGLEQHYLLTGDENSRFAVARVAEQMIGYPLADTSRTPWMESRIQARVLQALFTAWRLDARGPKELDLQKRLDNSLVRVLRTQRPDGGIGWPVTCGATLNYMHGLLNDVLIRIHTHYRADTAIFGFVRRNADYLWGTQWVPPAQAFKYMSARCQKNAQGEAVGGPAPAPDLNMLFVTTFGWLYQQTGDVRYRQAGDQIFAGGVKGAYLQGSKQFNEHYTSSLRYVAMRAAP
jgi:hypothetical protein